MKSFKNILLLSGTFLFVFLSACKKKEGEGGKSSINGMVTMKRYNPSGTVMLGEYPGAYEDVYIIYGDETAYGDKTETNPEGKYEFKYLREGNYRIYVYSKDSTGIADKPKFAVYKDVKLGKKEAVDAGNITVYTYQ